jgi:aspartate kinase
MKVYKFGGASVKDAAGIINLAKIVFCEKANLVVVVSALGKTTNALENVLKAWLNDDIIYKKLIEEIFIDHQSIITDLFSEKKLIADKISASFVTLNEYLQTKKNVSYGYDYDQVVSYGEIWSTLIIAEYLKTGTIDAEWIDIRAYLITDNLFRNANILWNQSTNRIRNIFDFSKKRIYITQGFIGGTDAGQITTLGREGSDYTAAVIANILNAEYVAFWKDVPGILNADPKWMPDAQKLDEISYKEAVEMTFSGAKVIHPKTIKPLHNKNIPLHVKSFLSPEGKGTVIKSEATIREIIPVFIKKEEQLLISIRPKDFSFVMGDNLSKVFQAFMINGVKVNLVQASAVSINVCVDNERSEIDALTNELNTEYSIIYNEKVELLTIRHYTQEAITKITHEREILLEQLTRSTVRFVVRKK